MLSENGKHSMVQLATRTRIRVRTVQSRDKRRRRSRFALISGVESDALKRALMPTNLGEKSK